MMKLYKFGGLLWDVNYDDMGSLVDVIGLCPQCCCKLSRSKEFGDMLEYKYACAKCGLTTTLNKSIEEKGEDFLNVLYSKNYKDAEIINLDGDLIRVQREGIKDDDYRIDAKISKNKKGELQLMVLAGSKKEEDKTQLFLDPTHERLAFDQNDSHPREVFSKVVAIFKNSTSAIGELPNDLDV